MGFRNNGIKWTWDESTTPCPNYYTTTTSTDEEELKINARKWKGEFIANSPTTPTVITYGWVCPKCGRANAPWVSSCACVAPKWEITC